MALVWRLSLLITFPGASKYFRCGRWADACKAVLYFLSWYVHPWLSLQQCIIFVLRVIAPFYSLLLLTLTIFSWLFPHCFSCPSILGRIPIEPRLAASVESGATFVSDFATSETAKAYNHIADTLIEK